MDPDQRATSRGVLTRRAVLGAGALAAGGGLVGALWPDGGGRPPAPGHGRVLEHRSGAAVQLLADARPVVSNGGDLAAIAAAEQAFALDLLRRSAPPGNVVLSPASLAIALAMLQLGAAGTTENEIARVLHTQNLSSAHQSAGWAALTDLLSADTGATVETANSVWQQRGLALRPAYLQSLARWFRTGVWQVDFAHHLPQALTAIDHWTSEHTHGRITKLFDAGDLTEQTVLVLADAVYFDATWKYRFDPNLTAPGSFRRADGTTMTVPFMHHPGPLATYGNGDFMAVQLPYAGGRFAAQLIQPVRGTVDDVIAGLTPGDLDKIASAPLDPYGELLVPRFTVQSYTRLDDTLRAMGMTTAFTDAADFSAMSRTSLAVQTVVQRDYLRVDERGTEAAAVTGAGMIATAARIPPAFDRPFVIVVRDVVSGVVLFVGKIVDPAE